MRQMLILADDLSGAADCAAAIAVISTTNKQRMG